jgi:hypothetical protein
MKIFNVSLRVDIAQIAEIPDRPIETNESSRKPFSDDPLDRQEQLMDKYLGKLANIAPPRLPGYYPGAGGQDGASMAQSVRISAESFDDLSAILKQFDRVVKELHPVPDSIVRSALEPPGFATPMG